MSQQPVPGPANGPFGFRHLWSLQTRPLDFYERLAQFGDVAAFRILATRAYLLTSPALIHEVLRDTGTRFRKLPRTMSALARGLGQGLLVADGDEWRSARRLVQPSFNRHAVEALAADALPAIDALLDRWAKPRQVELFAEMNRLTVSVAARAMLGVRLESEALRIGAAARDLAASWDRATRQLIPPPAWLPLPRHRRERAAVRYLRTFIHRTIDQRAASDKPSTDLLSRLLDAYQNEPGDAAGNRQRLVDQVLTLFIAGYHASTVTLCWTFYLISRHATIEQQVLREIDDVLGSRQPTLADVRQLTLTQQILKESMRLYPSAWEMFPRQAVEAATLGEVQIPRGALLFMSPYITHRDQRYFADPLKFDPDRWSPNRVDAIDQKAYFPFGGGGHVCVGKEMAMAQNTLMLAMILRRYRLNFQQLEHQPHHLPPMALVPRDPMLVNLERRCHNQPQPSGRLRPVSVHV